MKTVNNTFLLLAAAMLTAGVANAQTNQLNRTPTAPTAPTAPGGPDAFIVPNGSVPFSTMRGSYSQDSYISQSSTHNYANVDQVDNRTGAAATSGSGSSAAIEQTGMYNNAYQTQALDNSSYVNSRNEMRATQAGVEDQSRQTQTGGFGNTAAVTQAEGSSFSSAVQIQAGGAYNSAAITQSQFNNDQNDRNIARQTQTGDNQSARIGQQGHSGVVTQTQSGSSNSADGYQGARGANNTIVQDQSGTYNKGRVVQSSNFPQENFDRNYAKQTQSGFMNSADINQRAHDSYAEQVQSGALNSSRITQGLDGTTSNVASAAYTTQSGTSNSATVYQH